MLRSAAPSSDSASRTSLRFIQRLFAAYRPRDFAVRLWDGTIWPAEDGQSTAFTIALRHPGSVRRMFWPPNDLTLGEAFIYGDFDVEGDLIGFFRVIDHLRDHPLTTADKVRLAWLLFHLPSNDGHLRERQAARLTGRRHSIERDRQAITYGYDRTHDFTKRFSDEQLVLSGAYFRSEDDDLDSAQVQKLDYVCRKLRLRPGERLLDLGCGAGALVIYAAQTRGADAVGITISRRQVDEANQRIRTEGLTGRCRVEERDYRELDPKETYDKLVAIEMIGHVGRANLPSFLNQAWRLLRPGGVFLIQAIAGRSEMPEQRRGSFADRYVYPDSESFPLDVTLRQAESAGFEIRDVENLREHYALTSERWLSRLESMREIDRSPIEEVEYRVSRLTLSGFAHICHSTTQFWMYHLLLAKPDRGDSRLPLTRADWYA